MGSADYSATLFFVVFVICTPHPRPNYCLFFLSPSRSQQSKALATWRMRNPKRSRPEAVRLRGEGGGRGRGSQGVSARTEAEDEVRRRPAPGWGAHRPFLQILARRVEMLRALDPSRPPRRRTAAPRHLVMGAGPSVQPSWARTLPPAGLQKCERQLCVCPVSFGVLFPTAGC